MTKLSQKSNQVEFQEKLAKLLVSETVSIKLALRKMDEGGEKILFVVDESKKLMGTVTDGDIRRWLMHEGTLEELISKITRKNPKTLTRQDGIEKVREMMRDTKVGALPIVDSGGQLLDAYFWDDVFSDNPHISSTKIKPSVPVFIMAGGKGIRLDPFTKVLPKPLIPLGDKPIVEVIVDNFAKYGCGPFYLVVNYKGKMIQAYFESEKRTNIEYIFEENPLGTAGSLSFASKLKDASSFFVTNCDIVIKADYHDIWQYHIEKDADITIVASMRHFTVPYGVLKTQNGNCLTEIIEKPEYDFLVNTGFYVIKKEVIRHIPKDGTKPFDFPKLIEAVKNENGTIRVYPISEKSWLDAGEWQEYKSTLRELEL